MSSGPCLPRKRRGRWIIRSATSCTGSRGSAFHGRPHGQMPMLLSHSDVVFRAGCRDNNSVEVTAAGLLSMSGHARNGDILHPRLRESLRLWGVKWTMGEPWGRAAGSASRRHHCHQPDRRTPSGRPVDWTAPALSGERETSEASPIEITLVPSFAASIGRACSRFWTASCSRALGQPQARSVYRVCRRTG